MAKMWHATCTMYDMIRYDRRV